MPQRWLISALILPNLLVQANLARQFDQDAGDGDMTFSVPRVRQQSHVRDGAKARAKAFGRRGWRIPDTSIPLEQDFTSAGGIHAPSEDNKAAAGGVTASVPSIPEQYNSEYLSAVAIGTPPQTMMLDFDTGSADFWTFSTRQPDNETVGHSAFNPNTSSSWTDSTQLTWHIRYGDGTEAYGGVGTDTVNIGGAVVPKQPVELAESVSDAFVSDVNSDGLVGLGFISVNSVRPTQTNGFFENIRLRLRQQLFTVNLLQDGSGTYDFGYINASNFISQTYRRIPVRTDYGFWMFNSTIIGIGNNLFRNAGASPAIADTGTSLMIVDPQVSDGYWSGVTGAGYSDTYGGYVFPCANKSQLQSFQVMVGDEGGSNNYIVSIPAALINYAQVDKTYCYGGIQSNEGYGLQIYGDLLFRSAYFIFYGTAGSESLGVAQKT